MYRRPVANYWEDDDLILSTTGARTAANKALVTEQMLDHAPG